MTNAATTLFVSHGSPGLILEDVPATRFLAKPQLGFFASMLVTDLPDVKMWILGGEAPAFLKFEGPLFFMGPIWRIDWS